MSIMCVVMQTRTSSEHDQHVRTFLNNKCRMDYIVLGLKVTKDHNIIYQRITLMIELTLQRCLPKESYLYQIN
jgi:hypothetical protein